MKARCDARRCGPETLGSKCRKLDCVGAGRRVYRDVLNTPAFLAFLPTVTGLKGLDIGCGEAENTRALARQGAVISGVDFAPTFIYRARATKKDAPLNIEFHLADCKDFPCTLASFDFVVAFM